MIARRRFLQFAGAAVAAPSLPRIAAAQAYPSRPITMIVPYPAGGPTDTVGRTVAERMRAELGQPIVLENVSGAAGSIGLGRVARAAPDGYTIEVGNWSAHVVNGAIYTLPYDLKTDFEPIILCARAPEVVLSRKTIPATDLKGLIAWAKEHSGKYTIGHSGAGSAPHVAALQFLKLTGTEAQLVPYRGSTLSSPTRPRRYPRFVPATSKATPSRPPSASTPHRNFRPLMRQAFRDFTSRPGMGCLRPRERQRQSSRSSMPPERLRSQMPP
jgi:tripartite-type tricarboxylate transporter receptor subunit TctC